MFSCRMVRSTYYSLMKFVFLNMRIIRGEGVGVMIATIDRVLVS